MRNGGVGAGLSSFLGAGAAHLVCGVVNRMRAVLAGVSFSAASTALVSATSLAIVAALASTPALAGGGNGGNDGARDSGGAGGTGFAGNPGNPGTTCAPGACIGSGGG